MPGPTNVKHRQPEEQLPANFFSFLIMLQWCLGKPKTIVWKRLLMLISFVIPTEVKHGIYLYFQQIISSYQKKSWVPLPSLSDMALQNPQTSLE